MIFVSATAVAEIISKHLRKSDSYSYVLSDFINLLNDNDKTIFEIDGKLIRNSLTVKDE